MNFNLKQTKLSKNPGKNIMSRIIKQGSCINRYILPVTVLEMIVKEIMKIKKSKGVEPLPQTQIL